MNEENQKKNIIYLAAAPLTVGLMLAIVYICHGVYPFGTRTIAYYDLAQSYVPVFYHYWDTLHGAKNAYFDWNTALACSYADTTGTFLFFPSNLFLLFTARDNIIFTLSWVLLIKLMASAFIMSYYTSKHSNIKWLWVVTGIAYATCGYVVQYYTNIFFLDFVMLFPLLVLGLERLLKDGKKLLYILMLGLLAMSYQQLVIMIVIYLVLKAWIIIREQQEDKKAMAIIRFVICSIVAAMLTSAVSVPAVLQVMQSSRYITGSSNRLLVALLTIDCEIGYMKAFMLFGVEIGVATFIYGITQNKNRIKQFISSQAMLIFLIMPLLFESINLFWHGMSYIHFPVRFGYMITFEGLMLLVNTIDKLSAESIEETKQKKWMVILLAVVLAVTGGLVFGFCVRFRQFGIRDAEAYNGYWGILIWISVLYLSIILLYKKGSIGGKCLAAVTIITVVAQAFSGLYGFIAPLEEKAPESRDEYVMEAQLVADEIQKEDCLKRIKDTDIALNVNYGAILGQSSIGGWNNGANSQAQRLLEKLGYTVNFTRLIDGCGTAFSDAFLGVDRVYSQREVSSLLYSEGYEAGNGTIYYCNYCLPFAKLLIEDFDGNTENRFEYQNRLFTSLTGINEPVLVEYNVEHAESVGYDEYDNNVFEIELPIVEEGELYLFADGTDGGYIFVVNNQYVELPYLCNKENLRYKDNYYNGIVDLGGYAEESVKLNVLTGNDTLEDLHVALLRTNVLTEGVNAVNDNISSQYTIGNSSLDMSVDTSKAGTLVLPMGYLNSWQVTVDGSRQQPQTFEDALIALELEAGHHEISMKYVPAGIIPGALLSVIGLILVIVICRKSALTIDNEKLSGGITKAYHILYKLVVICLYVVPVICFVISLILSLIKL